MPTPDLGGLLRRPTRPAVVPQSPPVPDDDAGGPGSTTEPTTAPQARRSPHRPVPAASAASPVDGRRRVYLRPITVYLPRSLHERVHLVAAEQETSATALILLAVSRNHDRVAEALAAALREDDRAGGLFDIPQAKRAVEATVQTTIRVTDPQLETLNELVAELKVVAGPKVNRSLLVAEALRLDMA